MPELSRKSQKILAEQLFVHGDMNGKEVAEYLGVTEKTISGWREAGKWDEMKAGKTLGKDSLVRNLYAEALGITDDAKKDGRRLTSKEVDSLVKLAASIEKLDGKVNMATTIQVFTGFNEYLKRVDLALVKKLTEYQKRYLHEIAPKG